MQIECTTLKLNRAMKANFLEVDSLTNGWKSKVKSKKNEWRMDGRVERNKDVLKKSKYGCMKWEKLQIGRRKVISNEGF